jgi:LPS sulfotransferase NodH
MTGSTPSPFPVPPGRRSYDLVTELADYSAWEGPPLRSVLLCSHPRSGSTLLGEAIHAAGGLGCPIEYLHRGFRPTLAERWRTPGLPDYLRAFYRWRTDPSGVLASKVFWRDLEETAEERGSGCAAEDIVDQVFPAPVFIYLRRRDRVRQAVSAFVAKETGAFRALGDRADPPRDVAYSYEGILRQLAVSDYSHSRWQRFFQERGITPWQVCYEDLVTDYALTVKAVLSFLSSALEQRRTFVDARGPRLQRQADAASEGLVARFLRDHGAPLQGDAHDPKAR